MLYNCYPETNSSPLKIGQNCPKRKVHLSTHWNLSGYFAVISFREGISRLGAKRLHLEKHQFSPSILRSSQRRIILIRVHHGNADIAGSLQGIQCSGATFINGNG